MEFRRPFAAWDKLMVMTLPIRMLNANFKALKSSGFSRQATLKKKRSTWQVALPNLTYRLLAGRDFSAAVTAAEK